MIFRYNVARIKTKRLHIYILKLLGILAVLVAAGCVNYIGIHSNKKIAPPSQFQTVKSLPKQNGTWPTIRWAAQFGDPQLVELINEALANNPSLQAAQARIAEARFLAQERRADLYPGMNFKGNVVRARLNSHDILLPPLANSIFTEAGFITNLSYTLDIWGKKLSSLRQAISEERASEAADQEARLAIATAIASTYNQLAYNYELAKVLRLTVEQRTALTKISLVRLKSGLDTKVQTYQSRNTTATARTELVNIEGQIILNRQQLGTLLGKGPDRGLSIRRPKLRQIKTNALPANLPLNLLGRRPDIVGARWEVEAACQGIKYTKALFYPNVNLLAGVGVITMQLSHLTARANTEYAGPALSLPLFDGGALRAELRGQYAKYEEAVANYNDTLNKALSDVAAQVIQIKSIDKQLMVEKAALSNAKLSYDLARYQYHDGLASQLVVLNAESSYLNEQQTRLGLIRDRRNSQIALIKALGGGFNACCRPPIPT